MLVTGIAGWLFGWLADRSGSLAAPMLAHLAINEAGHRRADRAAIGVKNDFETLRYGRPSESRSGTGSAGGVGHCGLVA